MAAAAMGMDLVFAVYVRWRFGSGTAPERL